MAQTVLTIVQLKQNNYAVQAGDLAAAFAASDNVNGNSLAATGAEILLVQNTDSSAHAFSVTSVADALGRTDSSMAAYSVPANSFVAFELKQLPGWLVGGVINLTSTSNLLKFLVLRRNL